MKICVDWGRCTGLGLCESLAPTVFEVADNGDLVLLQDSPDDSLLDDVRAAVEACPTEALTLEE